MGRGGFTSLHFTSDCPWTEDKVEVHVDEKQENGGNVPRTQRWVTSGGYTGIARLCMEGLGMSGMTAGLIENGRILTLIRVGHILN